MAFPTSLWNIVKPCECMHRILIQSASDVFIGYLFLGHWNCINIAPYCKSKVKAINPNLNDKTIVFSDCATLPPSAKVKSVMPHSVVDVDTNVGVLRSNPTQLCKRWMRPIQMQAQTHIKASLFWEHCVIHSRAQKPLSKTINEWGVGSSDCKPTQSPLWFICQVFLAETKTVSDTDILYLPYFVSEIHTIYCTQNLNVGQWSKAKF